MIPQAKQNTAMDLSSLIRVSLLLSALVAVRGAPQLNFGRTTLIGQTISTSVEFFGGIPYAEPPIGQLRLRPPLYKPKLNVSTFDASNYGYSCIQPPLFEGEVPQSEDCLTINIHRPVGTKPSDRLPVFFYTYGGAYVIGGSPAYNGSEIVERSVQRGTPVLYVNFNYRLGPLGFPQGQEADDKKILNLGLQDQLAALEWVHVNIEFFGGNKKKVTAVGESAGSMMTSIQYLNPGRWEKLVRGAIMQSGVANSIFTFKASRNEPAWQKFIGNVPSCANLNTSGNAISCLRNASTDEVSLAVLQSVVLNDLAGHLEWTPAIDGAIIPDVPSSLFGRQRLAKVPIITGTNLDEGTLFTPQSEMSDQDIKDYLVGIISDGNSSPTIEGLVDEILDLYPSDPQLGSPMALAPSCSVCHHRTRE
ncbi:hypothetical protein NMY22_g7253 [Coprinellus aureogranulatus]|nr:hypothetical protein NMY22_g7253 [Coprinellus aureogranulatus]